MSTNTDSWLERVWRHLENRYDTDDVSCDCTASTEAVHALERSRITRADLAAYRQNELTMAELTAKVDAELDPEAIDDLGALAAALEQAAPAGTGE